MSNHPRFKRSSPPAIIPRPTIPELNNHELKIEIKYLRHRLSHWTEKICQLAFKVDLGSEDMDAVSKAISEQQETLERFLNTCAERDRRIK